MDIETLITEGVTSLISKYCPLSPETLAGIEQYAEIKSYKKGDILVREGAYSDRMYYILKGVAREYYINDKGKEVVIKIVFEHHFIAALNPYFNNIPSEVWIDVVEDCIMLETTRQTGDMLCDRFHDFERLGRLISIENMLLFHNRIIDLQFKSAEERYQALLEKHPAIFDRVPTGYIASFIGVSFETLSRIKNKK